MKPFLKLAWPLLIATQVAQATPTLYPTQMSLLSGLTNLTTSGLVADDTDLHKVYVLPPNVAEAEVNGLHSLSANVGFCGELSDLQSYSRTITKRIMDLGLKEIEYKSVVDKISEQLRKARVEAAAIATDKHLQTLVDLDNQIAVMDDRLTYLYKTSDTCSKDCDALQTEIRDTEKAKFTAQKDRRAIALQNAEDVRVYDRKKTVVDALVANHDEAEQNYDKIRMQVISIRNEFHSMYASYAKMEGGRAAFNYNSNWDSNVATLQANNPGFQFEKIVTQNAKLFASITSAKALPGDLAVIAYEMPGTQKDNYMELNSGFPGAISSNLVLSVVGVCPMLHPKDFNIPEGYGADKMAYGLTVTYEFPSSMKVQGTAKYNMYKMYEKVVSSGSSGGFFSSRSWTNVEERTFFKDSFNVDWITQDPQNTISEEQRLNTEHDMRTHIFERIATLALPSAPNRDAILAAGTPPPHGGVVVANSLMQACPTNIYCLGGSLILTSLDAIFGSSSSAASYVQTQNFDTTESWSQSQVIMKPWITTFVPAKN
jgi:hypothetical protein